MFSYGKLMGKGEWSMARTDHYHTIIGIRGSYQDLNPLSIWCALLTLPIVWLDAFDALADGVC